MDKNTIWAIVLSTVVIIASYLLLPIIFPSMAPKMPVQNEEQIVEEPTELTIDDTVISNESTLEVAEADEVEESNEPVLEEKKYVIKTNKAEVIFTNKGGDIISYKLLDHEDMDTKTGVQLADNISGWNRACAISLGKSNANIINDIFNVEQTDKSITFTKPVKINGKKVTLRKVYTFKDDENVFKLDVLIHTDDANGLNFDGTSYTIRTAPQIGPHYDPKKNRYENRQFVAYNGSKYKKVTLGGEQFKEYGKDFIWNGIAGKYFVELMIPSAPETVSTGYYSSKVEVGNYANAQAFIERRSFSGNDISDTYYMYYGPRSDKDLKKYNVSENNAWGLGGKKITECLQTSGWLNWLEKILKVVLELLNKVLHNWGVSIIVMTLILKIIMFPLSKKQSLGTLKMQELQPKLQVIQEKYKNDQQKLQQETQKIYQQAGYNPASGCLPMLFQFLILFAMYNLFNNYFEFRGAMFIPKWIPDLSSGDSVWSWNKNIPLITAFTGNQLRILPIIYTATQLLSGKITQYGQTSTAQNQSTMKFMMYGMPIMFFFLFYSAPAGLLLYWLTSNILQIFQQIIINKMMADKKAETTGKTTVQKKLPPKAKK